MSPRRGPEAEFTSYYGRPILKEPTWEARDIAGYLFAGGMAGASSALAAGASLTGRPDLARVCRLGATAGIGASLVALVHDLGKPARFVNMLRVAKPTSPMSVGSWLLSAYAPLVGFTAWSDLAGRAPAIGRSAGCAAGALGAGVAAYTAVLIADTAVPAWHESRVSCRSSSPVRRRAPPAVSPCSVRLSVRPVPLDDSRSAGQPWNSQRVN